MCVLGDLNGGVQDANRPVGSKKNDIFTACLQYRNTARSVEPTVCAR